MKIFKTLVLFVSGIVAGWSLLVINFIGVIRFCGDQWTCLNMFPVDTFVHVMTMLYYPILSLFLFSLITYFMRDAIFRPWFYFALGWIPLSMVLIYLTPAEHLGSWLDLDPFVKGFVAFLLSILFALISTIIIAVAWWKQRTKLKKRA